MSALLLLLLGCPKPQYEGDSCQACHVGIEPIHPESAGLAGKCTTCHGGNAESEELDAHVPVPSEWADIRGPDLPEAPNGFIKDFASDQLTRLHEVAPEYLQFINPGDLRVVDQTCAGCHPEQSETMKTSIMTTNAGHYMPTRFLADMQGQTAEFAAHAAVDPDCDPDAGEICEAVPLIPPPIEDFREAVADGDLEAIESQAIDHYLSKNCNHCHAAGYGFNDSPHLYRSTGCSSCHMLYDESGTYEGEDEAIPQGRTVFPKTHTLTTSIPTETCASCHFQGGRIGLNFRGIRESGSFEAPEFAEPWNVAAYRHVAGYYLLDEDSRNDVDETPPDVHFAAGMHCADCHVGTDVHGNGKLVTTSKEQVELNCEDCHGTIDQPKSADAAGRFTTSGGRLLPQLIAREGGLFLMGKVSGREHEVPQVATLLASGGSPAMQAAMGRDDNGWSHTDSMTCDTCHTSWNLFCLGCHVTADMSRPMRDHQTGLRSPGLVSGSREHYTLDHLLLGVREDGRIQTANPSQQLQLVVRDEAGELVYGSPGPTDDDKPVGWFRQRPGIEATLGFSPFFQHTTAGAGDVRTCADCHRQDESPEELARVRGVYGYGTGEFLLERADATPVDALQFLDDEGNSTQDWVHPGTGPVPTERRERALGVILSEMP